MESESQGEIARLLRESLEVEKENNRLIRRMIRATYWGFVFKIVWIALLFGLPLVLYYYVVGPYLEALRESSGAWGSGFNLFLDPDAIQGFFESFNAAKEGT